MASTPWNIRARLSPKAEDVLYGMDPTPVKTAIILLLQGESIETAQRATPQIHGLGHVLQRLAAGLRRFFGLSTAGSDTDDLIPIEVRSENAMVVGPYLLVHRKLTPVEIAALGLPQPGTGLTGHYIEEITDVRNEIPEEYA